MEVTDAYGPRTAGHIEVLTALSTTRWTAIRDARFLRHETLED